MKRLLLFSFLLFTSIVVNAQGWGQTQKIVPDDRALEDNFGWSVVMQGDVALVGAKNKQISSSLEGAVYVYNKGANDLWIQGQRLNNSDKRQFDFFGTSVDLDGNYMIVGARGQDYDENDANFENAAGAAYIFEKDGSGSWNEVQKVVSSDRGETFQPVFGETVAISGSYAVVNARDEDTGLDGQPVLQSAGACYIFERDDNGVWNEVQKIVASHRNAFDYFGDASIAISGNVIAVGAFGQDSDTSGNNSISSAGAVFVFERDTNGVWNETQKIVTSDREQGEWFGKSVAIQGNFLMVGASQEYLQGNLSTQYGAVYVFERDVNGVYNEIQKIKPDALIHQSKFGHSIAVDGDKMIVGAHLMNIGSVSFGGAAFMFEKDVNGIWTQTAEMYDPNVNSGDDFGYNVAISGDFAFVGAYEQDEDLDGLNPLSQAGAAYVFDVNEPNTLPSLNTLSVIDANLEIGVKAYPNPFENLLNLNLGKHFEIVSITIHNVLGQNIFSKTYSNTNTIQLDLNQPKGMYLIRVKTDQGVTSIVKVVKH